MPGAHCEPGTGVAPGPAHLILTRREDGRSWTEQISEGVFEGVFEGVVEEFGEKAERTEVVHGKDGVLILLSEQGMHMPRAFVPDAARLRRTSKRRSARRT